MTPTATPPTAAGISLPEISLGFHNAPTDGIRAGCALAPVDFAALRRKALLEGCKWDPQAGDVGTLSPFPLVMQQRVWKRLAMHAEQLATETVLAEEEILGRPELLQELGFPRALRKVLSEHAPLTPAAGRVIRFDFHLTINGWRISEANSDVPGGFSEASHFTTLMAAHCPGLRLAGNPASAWADALATTAGSGGVVALLSAPGYMEDHQVIAFLSARLRERGCRPYLASPRQVVWQNGFAHLECAWHHGRVDSLVRFYQAEWLARGTRNYAATPFFRGGRTPVGNPGIAAISESKRFPLVWDRLATQLPTWRTLLPETRDPRKAPWQHDDDWLLKTAMCNTGDTVSMRALLGVREWSRVGWAARCSPGRWVAQRRFESAPIATPAGLRHVCIGVYTVNGAAAGAYARLAIKPLVDFAATDAALLLEYDE